MHLPRTGLTRDPRPRDRSAGCGLTRGRRPRDRSTGCPQAWAAADPELNRDLTVDLGGLVHQPMPKLPRQHRNSLNLVGVKVCDGVKPRLL